MNAENAMLQRKSEASPVNRPVIVSNDKQTKQTIRKRLNDKSEASKVNTDKTGGSGTSKRLEKSRLLSPSIKQTEDCQSQLSNVKERSPGTVEMAAATVRATVSERSPVTAPVGVNDIVCDQRMEADNVDVVDSGDAQKELSAVSLRKAAGITSYT